MKLFIWQLNMEEKFSRKLLSEPFALLFLYLVLFFTNLNLTTKIWIAVLATIAVMIDLFISYKKQTN